ncbi:MAG: aldehyde ferredoxin oxidoreductase family protein [Candidatus Thorarchaeota archaeon]|nr:aldehyde ferredoxin oxidoreductase family protein [Candidatus Thorarchaeota archaeon]
MDRCRNGRILWVDLTTGTTRSETLAPEVYHDFIGGKGLGAYLLFTHLSAGVDPLGPENMLIFLTGPLQALPGPSVGRWSMVTKSPLTGLFLDSHCGGPLGREIKRAGYDAVCVTGVASSPSVLVLSDDGVSIDDAPSLWGEGIYTTTRRLHEQYGSQAAVYTIGPAGEDQIPFATGACEIAHQTGRGGVGAVLGSKRLKAVVAHGTIKFEASDPDELRAVNREVTATWRENTEGFKSIGTAALVEIANELGQFPSRNWKAGFFEKYEDLDMHDLHKTNALGDHFSCPHCIMRCTHAYRAQDPRNPTEEIESTVEYETLGLMGGNLGISDPETVLQLNYLCDDLGLDTISCGSVIGFAMECFERGFITRDDLGFDLRFGDAAAALRLVPMIAKRERIGATLALGVRRAAEVIGHGSADLAVHVKGLECAAWDPRGRRGMGLSYATAEVGASHLRGWPATTEPPDSSAVDMVESMVRSRDEKVLTDSLIVCHFTYHLPLKLEQKIRLLNAATGASYTQEDIFRFAHRVATLTRLFNIREGVTRKDDDLPKRFWEPQTQGPRKGLAAYIDRNDFEQSLDRFYEIRGWSKDGVPLTETVKQLGLDSMSL